MHHKVSGHIAHSFRSSMEKQALAGVARPSQTEHVKVEEPRPKLESLVCIKLGRPPSLAAGRRRRDHKPVVGGLPVKIHTQMNLIIPCKRFVESSWTALGHRHDAHRRCLFGWMLAQDPQGNPVVQAPKPKHQAFGLEAKGGCGITHLGELRISYHDRTNKSSFHVTNSCCPKILETSIDGILQSPTLNTQKRTSHEPCTQLLPLFSFKRWWKGRPACKYFTLTTWLQPT